MASSRCQDQHNVKVSQAPGRSVSLHVSTLDSNADHGWGLEKLLQFDEISIARMDRQRVFFQSECGDAVIVTKKCMSCDKAAWIFAWFVENINAGKTSNG